MKTVPWSDVGKDITLGDDISEAMTEANVNFNVSVRQVYFKSKNETFYEAKDHYIIVRDDIDIPLGTCKDRFQPLQNAEAFSIFIPLIEKDICRIDTIGCFGLGQKVWILAEVKGKKFSVLPDDDIMTYLLLMNAHDGTRSVTASILPIRFVCMNMLSMLKKEEYKIARFKHTVKINDKIVTIQNDIEERLNDIAKLTGELRELLKGWPNEDELTQYFSTVFELKDNKSKQAENKIKRLKELFILGKGNQHEKVRGTWYAAYNAVTEYLSYEMGYLQEARLYSLWFGVNNNINHVALKTAISMGA